MSKTLARCAAILVTLFVADATAAEPVQLKLAFWSSDRSAPYMAALKPFLDAVNAEAKGLFEIRLYPSGELEKNMALQPQLVLDGGADLAVIIPGYSPKLFPDNAILELPGLFRDAREASFVYTRLIAENALMGYRDFVVIGAYSTEPEAIHSRVPIGSIDDLKGKRIRAGNSGEAAALDSLGAVPVLLPLTEIADRMSSGAIDAAAISLTPLADFGIARVATHHFLLPTSGSPYAVVMSRKVFGRLPPTAQAIIQKYSGTWTAERFAETYDAIGAKVVAQLQSDPKRKVVSPSRADLGRVDVAFKAAREGLVSGNPHFQALLKVVETELANLRRNE